MNEQEHMGINMDLSYWALKENINNVGENIFNQNLTKILIIHHQ